MMFRRKIIDETKHVDVVAMKRDANAVLMAATERLAQIPTPAKSRNRQARPFQRYQPNFRRPAKAAFQRATGATPRIAATRHFRLHAARPATRRAANLRMGRHFQTRAFAPKHIKMDMATWYLTHASTHQAPNAPTAETIQLINARSFAFQDWGTLNRIANENTADQLDGKPDMVRNYDAVAKRVANSGFTMRPKAPAPN